MPLAASAWPRRLRLSFISPGWLPSRSVGPEPATITAAGQVEQRAGTSSTPYSVPLSVSSWAGCSAAPVERLANTSAAPKAALAVTFSDPDVVHRGALSAFVPRIQHPARLDEEQLHFALGVGLVL